MNFEPGHQRNTLVFWKKHFDETETKDGDDIIISPVADLTSSAIVMSLVADQTGAGASSLAHQ